ncbi:MAG: YjjG family noncanonical pyrimidine nucleotidase [Salibacteraceae bacterium]
MTEIKHIYFDLDHTLWDFQTNSRSALAELFQKYIAGFGRVSDADEFIRCYEEINDRLWSLYRNRRISKSRLRNARFEHTLSAFGINDKKLSRILSDEYVAISPVKTALMPGAEETLKQLSGQYTLHIITNGFEEIQHIKLRNSGIIDYFDKVVTSESAGASKPNRRIFDYAAKLLNAHPRELLMVGDSIETDVQGAMKCGWRAVLYSPRQQVSSNEFAVISDLRELAGVIR